MEALLSNIQIQVNEKIFQKDPTSSDLGQKILRESLSMIDELGLENFTFKKLALRLNTTESSIYRYFENKHKLLIYHVSWYWSWLSYRLVFATANMQDPGAKLEKAIHLLVHPCQGYEDLKTYDIKTLQRIIIHESSKAYLTKEVDEDNKEGFFSAYKDFCSRLVAFIKESQSAYKFPSSLVATTIEGIHLQKYFKEHLPSLSDAKKGDQDIELMFSKFILNTINH